MTSKVDVQVLKPCPLCGGEAVIIDNREAGTGASGMETPEPSIRCTKCKLETARVRCTDWPYGRASKMLTYKQARESIITAWNTRIEAQTISPATAEERDEQLRKALEPFAAMGRVMEKRAAITFGHMPKDTEIVCESSGEAGMGILTMGHFRDAAALLPDAPGWGGMYQPRAAFSQQLAPASRSAFGPVSR
jgi:ribosomal protein L37E